MERSTNDAYNNPGTPVTTENEYGRQVLEILDGKKILMTSNGASPKGDLPFLAVFDLDDKKNNIIWRSEEGIYEANCKRYWMLKRKYLLRVKKRRMMHPIIL